MITKQLTKFFVFLIFFFSFGSAITFAQEKNTLLFFWAEGCPHCATEEQFLDDLQEQYPNLHIERYEVSKNKDNQNLLTETGKKLNFDTGGVPVTVVGNDYIIGYSKGSTDKKIKDFVAKNYSSNIEGGEICTIEQPCPSDEKDPNTKIDIPFFGYIDTKNFSLPLLSIIIGSIDGFNPCAMWTLLFLISLLLGMKDRRRMWILGSTFIVVSALVYFIFMSAWLNLLLFIGFIAIVRIIIGLVALGGGIYNLRDFFVNKDAGCKISGEEKKKATVEKLKKIVGEKSFLLAFVGIIGLAFAVNMVELICSAGLPAIYTQILSMSHLSGWQYYGYILLYILFFMLDDMIIFFIAMTTLHLTGITTKYSRISRLVGGIIMLIIGLILIFKPSLLMFG